MADNGPYVVTISRQLGSGGAYVGQRLATKLKIGYFDREIISRAAVELNLPETELVPRDEKMTARWQTILTSVVYSAPAAYPPPFVQYYPSDREIYHVESEVIRRIASERSAVIVGRCGSFVLREHPRHLQTFQTRGAKTYRDKRPRTFTIHQVNDGVLLVRCSTI